MAFHYPKNIRNWTFLSKFLQILVIIGSASFNSPNANLMQNKRIVRGNTYAQRVGMRTYNVTSTLEDRNQLGGTSVTPGLMQRSFNQRNQLLPNLGDGQIQVINTQHYFCIR